MRLEQLEYFNNRHHHSLYTRWKGQVKTGQAEQLDVLCCVPEALHGCNSLKMTILVFLHQQNCKKLSALSGLSAAFLVADKS